MYTNRETIEICVSMRSWKRKVNGSISHSIYNSWIIVSCEKRNEDDAVIAGYEWSCYAIDVEIIIKYKSPKTGIQSQNVDD